MPLSNVYDVQTWFEKNDAYRIYNPTAERVNAKSQYILHRKWTFAYILCIHQQSYKLDKGIMLIFVSEKNRPLLLAKGVYYRFYGTCNLSNDKAVFSPANLGQ